MHRRAIRDFSAAILVDTAGRFLLQRRDDKPGIAHPGKVAFFGGGREEGESPLDCIVREIAEEIGMTVTAERFDHLISLDAPDPEHVDGHVRGEYFVARDISTADLIVTEGTLLIISREGVAAIRNELTPLTTVVLEHFLRQTG
jgi:8-oxo-dGTP pyrophosphatase MutT (NUDIX family)